MPFTFSHPALILPFRFVGRKYFSITGLVVGTVVPDFEYFVRLKNMSYYSHTWAGAFWFDLPIGVLLCFVFHNIIKGQFILNSPYLLHIRFIRFYHFNWNKYFTQHLLIVACSILIGVFTHLIGDRVTHKSFHIVTSVPDLKNVQSIAYHPLRVYRFFQSLYSTAGILLILLTIWYLPVNRGLIRYRPDMRYWFLLSGIFTSAFTLFIMIRDTLYVDYVISSISAFLVSILATSIILLPRKRLLFTE
ncbi:MAG TPA: DUF4184 family protein [Chitinophagaceae bacterium]|jgi:hypothetical protein|nr:DUF4184 family protein [Chitinophagaceae bacterium]